jgi:hypothetical protein
MFCVWMSGSRDIDAIVMCQILWRYHDYMQDHVGEAERRHHNRSVKRHHQPLCAVSTPTNPPGRETPLRSVLPLHRSLVAAIFQPAAPRPHLRQYIDRLDPLTLLAFIRRIYQLALTPHCPRNILPIARPLLPPSAPLPSPRLTHSPTQVISHLTSWWRVDGHHKGDSPLPAPPGRPADASIIARNISASLKRGPCW